MTPNDFARELSAAAPSARPLIDEHDRDHDGLWVHLLLGDVRRLAIELFVTEDLEQLGHLLEVADRGFRQGDETLRQAIAVSFLEHFPDVKAIRRWRTRSLERCLPRALRDELRRQRQWSPPSPALPTRARGRAGRYPCVCCGYLTLAEAPPGTYDICAVCSWEDDAVQAGDPDYRGGANAESLNDARANFRTFGASSKDARSFVRPPRPDEHP